MRQNDRLWPRPTVDEIAAELRARIKINRKEAGNASDGRAVFAKVCERTAEELSRLLFWIEGRDE